MLKVSAATLAAHAYHAAAPAAAGCASRIKRQPPVPRNLRFVTSFHQLEKVVVRPGPPRHLTLPSSPHRARPTVPRPYRRPTCLLPAAWTHYPGCRI